VFRGKNLHYTNKKRSEGKIRRGLRGKERTERQFSRFFGKITRNLRKKKKPSRPEECPKRITPVKEKLLLLHIGYQFWGKGNPVDLSGKGGKGVPATGK